MTKRPQGPPVVRVPLEKWLQYHHACGDARAWIMESNITRVRVAWKKCDADPWMYWFVRMLAREFRGVPDNPFSRMHNRLHTIWGPERIREALPMSRIFDAWDRGRAW